MVRRCLIQVGSWVLSALLVGPAPADYPDLGFTYQGVLTEDGSPVNGQVNIDFSLYDVEAGGVPIATADPGMIDVSEGLFTVAVDFCDAGCDLLWGQNLWVEITVEGETLTERQQLRPAPAALALPALRVRYNAVSPNIIGGVEQNAVPWGEGNTIGGGGTEGEPNTIGLDHGSLCSTIGGGYANQIDGPTAAMIAGGYSSRIDECGDWGFIGGGRDNLIIDGRCTIAGGSGNTASARAATVCGGEDNTASGERSVVCGGEENEAHGDYSFAAGERAKALHDGAFVWADNSGGDDLESTAANEWIARAAGGFYLYTNKYATVGAWLPAGQGDWQSMSDRNVKENLESVDAQDVLSHVVSLPISTWNYKSQKPAVRHIGPMAQDFHEAFGVGVSDRFIGTLDADGVALAAIQGVHQLIQDKDEEIARLQARLSRLEATLMELTNGKQGGGK